MRFKNTISIILSAAFVISPFFVSAVSAKEAIFNASVTTDKLFVRSGPGKEYQKVGQLEAGRVVKVFERKNGWYRIATKQWVGGQFLKKTSATATADEPIAESSPKIVSATSVNSADTATTNLTATCLKAIKKANFYCLSIASGCASTNKTKRCIVANQKCEVRQEAALKLCPSSN